MIQDNDRCVLTLYFPGSLTTGPKTANKLMKLLKTGFWNGGQRWRCAKIVGKSGFSKYLFDFVVVLCDTTR